MRSRLGDEAVELCQSHDQMPDDHSKRKSWTNASQMLHPNGHIPASAPMPEVRPSQDSQRLGTTRARKFSGWRIGAIASASATSLICLLNLCVTIWVAASYPQVNGIATVYRGSCQTVDRISLGLHVVINVLGSILLGASNYCMQCLAAPTRPECDKAHQSNSWLDVGVNSVRNLFKIGPARTITWFLLAITSIPIHLVYNSAVFKVLSTNAFKVLVVNERFLSSSSGNFSTPIPKSWPPPNANCTLMHKDTKVSPESWCKSDCVATRRYGGTSEYPINDWYFEGANITYPNGSSQILHLDESKQQSWSVLSNCHFLGCKLNVTGVLLDKPSLADYLDRCFSYPASALWRQDAETAKQHYLQHKYERLSLDRCISIYGQDFVSDWNHVFFVTKSAEEATIPAAYFYTDYEEYHHDDAGKPYSWLCSNRNRFCNVAQLQQDLSQFTLGEKSIDHCMAQPTSDAYCEVQFSTTILAVIIICNALKATLVIMTVLQQREAPLVAIGDAIASYLDRPDQASRGYCLISSRVARNRRGPRHSPADLQSTTLRCQQYNTGARRCFQNVAVSQLVLTLSLVIGCLIATASLLASALDTVYLSFGSDQSPWKLGFGTATAGLMLDYGQSLPMSSSTFISSVLMSNLPQLIVSFVYVIYNGFLTSMAEGKEWSGYARGPKALRVTSPSTTQRSTYFLTLPYRFGLPLLVASTCLHWLISSSLFLVRVDPYLDGVKDSGNGFTFAGYSPLPILVSLCLGILMLLAGCAMGMLRLDGTMPLVSSNSFAIAAACHPPAADTDAAMLAVHWGEVEIPGSNDIGHCTFTSFETRLPTTGKYYR